MIHSFLKIYESFCDSHKIFYNGWKSFITFETTNVHYLKITMMNSKKISDCFKSKY